MPATLQSSTATASRTVIETGPLLAAVVDAKRETGHLLGPEHLVGTVDALVLRAHALGAHAVYGASDIGQSLAGAMAYASPRLRLWEPREPAAVLLIDGVIAGLSGIRLAAERLKRVGAKRVEALVVGALGDLESSELRDASVERVLILGREHSLAA
jgi:hypothetical protein